MTHSVELVKLWKKKEQGIIMPLERQEPDDIEDSDLNQNFGM